MKIAAAILAGGQSRRMGTDKATLPSPVDPNTTLLRRTAELASAVFAHVLVVGRPQPNDWAPLESEATIFLPDEESNLGPAGGLATALKSLAAPEVTAVALLACDLPLLTIDSLLWLKSEAELAMEKHGLVVRNGEQIEPLFAVYTRDVLPLLEDQLAQGRRSLQKLIEKGDFRLADAPEQIGAVLVNVNTAEEFAAVQSQAKR